MNEPKPSRLPILHSRAGRVRNLATTSRIPKIQFHKGDYANARDGPPYHATGLSLLTHQNGATSCLSFVCLMTAEHVLHL